MESRLVQAFEAQAALYNSIHQVMAEPLARAVQLVAAVIGSGGKILFCGNGGSAADAQHLAAEFIVRLTPGSTRRPLPALALTTDSSVLTAAANDFGFQEVFARQISALGMAGDLLIAITTSGRSANILRALEAAKASGLKTLVFTGEEEGGVEADIVVRAPAEDVARIQELQIFAGHILIEQVEKKLHSEKKL